MDDSLYSASLRSVSRKLSPEAIHSLRIHSLRIHSLRIDSLGKSMLKLNDDIQNDDIDHQTIESIQKSAEEVYEEISNSPLEEQAMKIIDGLMISTAEMHEKELFEGNEQLGGASFKSKSSKLYSIEKKYKNHLHEKGWCFIYKQLRKQGESKESAKGFIQELKTAQRNKTGVNWALVTMKYYTRWFFTKLVIVCGVLMVVSYFSVTAQIYWGELTQTIYQSLAPIGSKLTGLYGDRIDPYIGRVGGLPDNQGWIKYFKTWAEDKANEFMILIDIGLTEIHKFVFIPFYYGMKYFNIGVNSVSIIVNTIAGYSGLLWFGSIGLMGVSILILILAELPQYFQSKFDPRECEEL